MKIKYIYLKEHEIENEINFQWDKLLKEFTQGYGVEDTPCIADVTVHELNNTSFRYEVDDYSDCTHFSVKEIISMKKTKNTIEIKKTAFIYNYEFDEYTEESETELLIFTQRCDLGIGVDKDKLKELQKNHRNYHKNTDEMTDFE